MLFKLRLTVADLILAIALLLLAGVTFFIVPARVLSGTTQIQVYASNKLVGRYNLDQDRMIEVSGPLGKTLLRVKAGRAAVVSSPCPHKMCMKMGDIGPEGGFIVCAPNEVYVTAGKDRFDDVDAVTK